MADTSVKLSGTYDSIEAYNIMVEMQEMSADYEAIRTEAAAAASAATAASAAATNAINTANTAVSNAQTYAGNASDSADDAAGYASNASTSATNAASSATDASNSAAAAATSETNAAASATNAAASEAVVNGALPLSGGTMTGNISYNGSNSEEFSLGLSSATNIDIGWNFANQDGALLALRGNSDNDSGEFELFARNASNSASLVGTPNGNLKWKGWNIPAGYLGDAPNNTAKTFTLPASGTYLIMTAHNSTPGVNSIFMVSLGNGAFKMGGGANITMTTSNRNITVTSSSGAARVYYIILNTVS